MEAKMLGLIHKMQLKKEGEYRVEFRFPFSEIATTVSMVRLLNTTFSVIITAEAKKAVIPLAYFYRLTIDREGESRIVLSFSFETITNESLAFFGQHQNELITVQIKGTGK